MSQGIVYLASPYSSQYTGVREQRFSEACLAAGLLLNQGVFVFSPIAHSHPIAEKCDLPKGFDFWGDYDEVMLSLCEEILVLQLPGWESSSGVCTDIEIAKELELMVLYTTLSEIERGSPARTKP